MRRSCVSTLLSLLFALHAGANPVISEIMADNESTIPDENGDFSDWIEIHNPTSAPIPLANWALTDKSSNLTQWRFPAVTLQPGEFLVVWASSKNRRTPGSPLHTNFALTKDGEYLALVRPDGTTIEQQFSPKFPAQKGDESYGSRFTSTVLLAPGAGGRYRIPTSASNPAADWNQPSHADGSWPAGPSGYGFGINLPGISVRQVSKNGNIGGLVDALDLLSRPTSDPLVLSSNTAVFPVVNFLGEGADGRYGENAVLPGGGGDHYAVMATGNITIPTAGIYTFGLNSDDGGRILIDGVEIMRDDSWHGPQDNFGTANLTAGLHTFQVVMFEGGSGDCLEFFAAPGTRTFFDAGVFRLVGDTANGGLAASTTPQGASGAVGTDIASAMTGRSSAYIRMPFNATGPGTATALSLVMRYNDGFTTWLNGTPAASANAPASPTWNSLATASRTNSLTLFRQGFNLTPQLPSLTNGQNLLAIHGLNVSASDGNFLIQPEIIAGSLDAGELPVFYGNGLATPGWINGTPSSLGNVADTQFSVRRGFYTSPISVAITSTTPGAVIRYTTDGSTPSATQGFLYTNPLNIAGTTVIRAIATLNGWEPTDVDTQTYLFPDDIITQSADGSPPPGWPATSGTDQVMDHGMDPDIVNHTNPQVGGPAVVKSALLAIPTVSVTTDLANLLNIGGSRGIYASPYDRGFAWERPVSMEWINPPDTGNPNGTSEFQIDAGMRIRGGYSRSMDNPKHAVRFLFRAEYGDSKLRYPLFGRDAAQEFDKIDLRTSQNYSWSFAGDDRNTFLREEATRVAQLDMGNTGSHVRYVHLYLNGRYWGLYDLDERPEASFAETYMGGDKDDYDVIKSEGDTDYTTAATDGNLTAWHQLYGLAKTHRANPTNANYFRMMGLAADGVTPTADPVLLDPDNLIDYMLLTFWSGNFDGCVSSFLGNNRANNWYGIRRRDGNPRAGFRYIVHDFEHSLLDVNEDRTGPFASANESNVAYYNPMFLHQDLMENTEYRMRWADRVHRHLFNGGALTPAGWQNRINKLATVVDSAIVAESARWGDTKDWALFTRLHWQNAQNNLINYLTPRNPVVLNQLRADNLYPALDAPVLSPYSGHQPEGTEISIQGPAGATLYYMSDGSDPRAPGGAIRTGASVYTSTSASETLIPWSAGGWKYLGDGSDQGIAWRTPGHDDSAWPTGSAELGYGDGDEATVIPYPDINPSAPGIQKPATCYFRRSFNVTNPNQITGLSLGVEFDDGYIVYVNGTRVAGTLPLNPAFNQYATAIVEDTIETVSIPSSVLVSGTNVIAVEVHQCSDSSSDLSMNLQLTATRTSTGTPMTLAGVGPKTVRVRAWNQEWSALAESTYQIGTAIPTAAELVVSEICYFPPSPHGDAEFIELLNTSSTASLDLGGARFTEGIDFKFPAGTTLAPGARILVVQNIASFEALFGSDRPIAGIFANDTALSNSGERLRLETPDGTPLLDFSYGINFPWPANANGLGRSMVLTNPSDPANPLSWRPSAGENGNPGETDSLPRLPGQSLLDYALASPATLFDSTTGDFSVTRRLGADAAHLAPEWSTDLGTWHTGSLGRTGETTDSAGNSTLTWKLDPLPPGQAFIRLRVVETP